MRQTQRIAAVRLASCTRAQAPAPRSLAGCAGSIANDSVTTLSGEGRHVATGDAVVTTRGRRGGLFGFHMTPGRGVSWGAVFAGRVIGMALQIVLTLLGVAIGLGAADDSARGASIGAGIWALVAALISAWIGGRVAGAAARSRQRGDGAFHGILAWALSTLIAIWLLSSGVGRILGGAANMAGNVMGGATAGAAQGAAMRPADVRRTAENASQEA